MNVALTLVIGAWSLGFVRGLLDLEQFHQKVQRRVRRHIGPGAPLAISQVRRNRQLDHSALADQLHPFRPAGDHAVQRKRNRLAAAVRAVKDLAVVQPAVIVDVDLVRGLWLSAGAVAKNPVLQARARFGERLRSVGIDFSRSRRKLRKRSILRFLSHHIYPHEYESQNGNAANHANLHGNLLLNRTLHPCLGGGETTDQPRILWSPAKGTNGGTANPQGERPASAGCGGWLTTRSKQWPWTSAPPAFPLPHDASSPRARSPPRAHFQSLPEEWPATGSAPDGVPFPKKSEQKAARALGDSRDRH